MWTSNPGALDEDGSRHHGSLQDLVVDALADTECLAMDLFMEDLFMEDLSMKKGGVRILGGHLRGRRLEVPSTARPTESRVREALFSIWGQDIVDCRFLDLFAGSGAVGIEALSRGAKSATFVESAKSALAALRRNLRLVPADDHAVGSGHLMTCRLPRLGERLQGLQFDLAYADPPYDFPEYGPLMDSARGLFEDHGELVIEHESRTEMPDSDLWQQTDVRRYGTSCLSFFRPLTVGS